MFVSILLLLSHDYIVPKVFYFGKFQLKQAKNHYYAINVRIVLVLTVFTFEMTLIKCHNFLFNWMAHRPKRLSRQVKRLTFNIEPRLPACGSHLHSIERTKRHWTETHRRCKVSTKGHILSPEYNKTLNKWVFIHTEREKRITLKRSGLNYWIVKDQDF